MPNNNRLNRIKFLLLSHIFKVFSVIAIFPSRSSRKKYSLFNIKGYLLCHFLDRSSIDSNPPNNSSLTTQEKKIRFLFSGRVCTERFFPQLLDIFNNIIEKEKRYSVELLVAGGSDIENINSIIKSPKIFMLGLLEREQLDKLEYDCLISLMSLDREEAFGYSIGEAAVRNKYIICNSGAGIVHHISYNRMVLIDNVNYKSVEESINSALKLIQENIPPTLVFSNQEMLTGEHWLDSLNKIVLFHTSSTFRT